MYDNKIRNNAQTKMLEDYMQGKGKGNISFCSRSTSSKLDYAPLNQQIRYKKCGNKTVNVTVGLIKLDYHGYFKIKSRSRATIAFASTGDFTRKI